MSTPKTLLEMAGADLKPASLAQSALVIVDAQNEYLGGKLALPATRAALDLGYGVSVAGDAAATRDLPDPLGGVISAEELHRAAFAELADRFAVVTTVDQIPSA